jgi:hypothetical protein
MRAGRAAWAAATRVHAARLESCGEPQLAVLHLLALDDVSAALSVLRRAGLLRDAVALGTLRLLPEDPALKVGLQARARLI